MFRAMKLGVLAVSAVIFMSGCTVRLADFTVLSTKNARIPTEARGDRVIGQDCAVVFIVPLRNINVKEAIDRAIENAGPEYDALVDGVVSFSNHSFIFGQQCYKVEGTPINTKASVSMNTHGDFWLHS